MQGDNLRLWSRRDSNPRRRMTSPDALAPASGPTETRQSLGLFGSRGSVMSQAVAETTSRYLSRPKDFLEGDYVGKLRSGLPFDIMTA